MITERLYLSGPITGNPNYLADFAKWEAWLVEHGYQVFNPAALGDGELNWSGYLKRDLPFLMDCDGIFAMPGWEGSRGAQLEIDLARRLEMKCLTVKDGQVVDLVGRKFDGGKPRWSLLPMREIRQVVEILTDGAVKYDDDNWKTVRPISRYIDALGRHWDAWREGEVLDDGEGGDHRPHLAHLICNAIFLLWHDNEVKQ